MESGSDPAPPAPETPAAAIESWIRNEWPNNALERRMSGSYGSVYVFVARHESQIPHAIAAKTLNVDKSRKLTSGLDLEALFKRELRLWMNLPHHRNVLGAIQIRVMPVPEHLRAKLGYDSLPFVTMPYCDATLRDWIELPPVPGDAATPLIALAWVCNGLCWIYDQGIHGHGDLKPENILVRDLRRRYRLPPDGYPSPSQPWEIKLADFGWADIWRDLGGTEHAWRPYLAPERLDGHFEPQYSDVFAVGVIATELLTGKHPAGKESFDVGRWKISQYSKWARAGARDLTGIHSEEIREIVARCLTPIPPERPTVAEVRDLLTQVLARHHGLPVGSELAIFNSEADQWKQAAGGKAWAELQVAKLGPETLTDSIQRALTRVESFGLPSEMGDAEAAHWLVEVQLAVRLIRQGGRREDSEKAAQLAAAVGRAVLTDLWGRDLRKDVLGPSGDKWYETDELPDFLLSYATWAMQQLQSLVGITDPRYLEIQVIAHRKYREYVQTWDLRRMFGDWR